MGQTLKDIAQTLQDKTINKKVQLIYAFNGVGKTRLSREFKELIASKTEDEDEEPIKVLYYNAFTEDLFYWDNDSKQFIIHPNNFTNNIFQFLKEQGQDNAIATHFQHYTNSSITPKFDDDFSKITFDLQRGGDDSVNNIKISKGEESNFIWCVFYSLLEQVIDILNTTELDDRSTDKFNQLQYIFIDDPVTSLDENHLIELAVNLAEEIIKSDLNFNLLKFIITTHNPLFYNVLCNTLKGAKRLYLEKLDDGSFEIKESNDSPFSYHLFLLSELDKAIQNNEIKKYHYNLLRQLLEKTATFLGYDSWKELLPGDASASQIYYNLIINLCSHAKHSGEEISLMTEGQKRVLKYLVDYIKETYHFNG